MENVDAVLNEQNLPEFRRWLAKLTSLGYTSSYKVLNAKDYGVPQNRKRIFVVSMLGGRMLDFPRPCPDGRVLRDVLEEDVSEEFYLSEERVAKYRAHESRASESGNGFGWVLHDPEDIAGTVRTKPDSSSSNFIIVAGSTASEGEYEQTGRVYSDRGIAPTMVTSGGGGHIPKIKVTGTLGGYEKEGRVHNPDGLSPTLNLCRPDHAPKIEVIGHIEGYQGQSGRVHDAEGLAPTAVANRFGSPASLIEVQDSIRYPCATAKGYMEAREGGGLVMNRVLTARGTVQESSAPTLTTGNGCGTGVVVRDNDSIPDLQDGEVAAMLTPGRDKRQNGPRCKTDGTAFTVTTQDRHGIAENDHGKLRIRYLTPRECWRLMGFPDSAYEAARDVPTSKTQLYKQAGNSIAVPCLEAIFKAIYIDQAWHRRPSLESWT